MVMVASDLNAYDVVRHKKLLMAKDALEALSMNKQVVA
jgi:ribosomal protein L4